MILSPSPPPPPPPAQPTVAQSPMQATDTTETDPHITSLKAIFPDFDDAVILSVLESTDHNHDRALDVLLGMNDPTFVPPAPPPSQSPNQLQYAPSVDAQRLSQEELDEQLARRLAFEEQQAAGQVWPPQAGDNAAMYQAHQPRRGVRFGRGGQPQGQSQTQGQGGKDTMTEFQEGFNRIAESGRKTFSSIVSKVRAKMQEFEHGQGWSGSQNPAPEQLAPSSPDPSNARYQQQGSLQDAYAQPRQSMQFANSQRQTSGAFSSSPPRSGIIRPAATEPVQSTDSQEPLYYDPNTRGYDLYGDEEEVQMPSKTIPSAGASATAQRSTTPPRTDSPVTLPSPSNTSSPSSFASPVSSPPNSRLSSTTPPARSPSTPGGVDFSKLGLLPKRPISLVRPQSPPAVGASAGVGAPRVALAHSESTTASSTDRKEPEEEIEFVENPFEDHK